MFLCGSPKQFASAVYKPFFSHSGYEVNTQSVDGPARLLQFANRLVLKPL